MRRRLRTLAALALPALGLLFAPSAAPAQRLSVRVGAGAPFSECYCRAKGRLFAVGETACLSAVQGPRQATCGMDQNVTSWRFSDAACPDS